MITDLTTGPKSEPVTLAQTKDHLRVDITDDDDLISALIQGARRKIELDQHRQHMTATWTGYLDSFPAGTEIELPYPPLQSVTSIRYLDADGATQTFSSGDYSVDTTREPGRVILGYNKSWPTAQAIQKAVTIIFVAGYRTPFTADASSDAVTADSGLFFDDDGVRLYTTNTLPAGLAVDTDYHVVSQSGNTCKLSATSGGSAINITTTGTGTHHMDSVPRTIKHAILLTAGHWYENREQLSLAQGVSVVDLPHAAEALIWQDRIMEV